MWTLDCARFIDRCLARAPDERFTSAELRDALEALIRRDRISVLPRGNPYRGLMPFEAEHRGLFFGRDSAIREVAERLRSDRLVLITGESGVGKSSLARAGILPRVTERGLDSQREWAVCTMVPGRHPLATLISVLARRLGIEQSVLEEMAARDVGKLIRFFRGRHGDTAGTLLFIDQLEELITVSAPQQAASVASMLAEFSDKLPGMRVLATVRGDRVTDLARLGNFGALVERAMYILTPLSDEGIRQCIVGPARAVGARFESPALVDTLVESASRAEGGLPLLQFALAQLWDSREADQNLISEQSLRAIGGVNGALSRHADSVIRALLPGTRQVARQILINLVGAHNTRRRRPEDELIVDDGTWRAALDALVDGRLVVVREIDGNATYEIAHEALISSWLALRRWLDEEGGKRIVIEHLATEAAEWDRLGRPSVSLWRKGELAEADQVEAVELPAVAGEFLLASRRAEKLARWGWRSVPIVVLLIAAGIYGGLAYKKHAEINRLLAEVGAQGGRGD